MNANLPTPKLRRPIIDALLIALTVIGASILLASWQLAPEQLIVWIPIALFLYAGFGIPRWQGWSERIERAKAAKSREQAKWGFHSRDREGPWLNYVDFPLIEEWPIATDKYFYGEWLIVHDGLIIVNPGPSTVDLATGTVSYDFSVSRTYAWDGCSPKRWFFWLALFGPPDGQEINEDVETLEDGNRKTRSVFWQRAHHASLVHDALYQYLDTVPIAKKDVNELFRAMLRNSGFHPAMACLYHFAVKHFGGRDVKRTAETQVPKLVLSNKLDGFRRVSSGS